MNKNTLRSIVLAGLFLIPFVPFLVSSSLFFPFITTKAFAFRAIVEIIFAAWAVLALVDKEYRPKKSPILYAVGAFLVVIGFANAFGADPMRSIWSNFERMEGYLTLLHLGGLFLVMSSTLAEENWRRWWNTSLVASGLMVIYCLFQLGGAVTINQGGVRVDGTFGNASYLAVYLLIHIFVAALFMWRSYRGKGSRWGYGLLLLGQLVILYYTATRGAILGLLGGALIVALLNAGNREEKALRKMSLGLLGALVLIVGGFFLVRNSSFVTDSPVLSRFSSITTEEIKSGGRSFVWPMAIEGVKERPILGWGQENFLQVFQKHYDPEMHRLEPWFDRAHNIFLDWAVAGGLLGLLAYLSLYGAFLHAIWRRDAEFTRGEKSILTGLTAAYFFHNLFVFDHLISYVLFFSLLAYMHARNSEGLLWERTISYEKGIKVALPLAAIVLALSLYALNWKPLRANSSLIAALGALRAQGGEAQAIESFKKAYGNTYLGGEEAVEQIASQANRILTSNIPVEQRNDFYAFARNAAVTEAEENPESAKRQIVAGNLLSITGAGEEGKKYLDRALALAPNKQAIRFEIGANHITAGRFADALAAFRAAYQLAPEYEEARIIYLLGAIYAGDRATERELLPIVPEQALVFDDRILSAYFNSKRFAEAIQIIERRKILDAQNASRYDEYLRQIREQM